jgi:predicted SnoaL-like aldol condensation-catalyzing enzyme
VPKVDQVDEFIQHAKSVLDKQKAITGIFIACFLVAMMNMEPTDAITFLRSKRPGSICNRKQEAFIDTFKEHWKAKS